MQALKEQQIKLSEKILNTAYALKQMLRVLLNDTNLINNRADFFTFNDKNKKATSERLYSLFSVNASQTSNIMSNLANKNAELASLLIAADKAMDIELIAVCEKQFTAYEQLEKNYFNYITAIENENLNSNLTINFLVKTIKKLELELDNFISIYTD